MDEHVVLHLANGAPVVADRLICATGFEADVRANSVIDDPVTTYGLAQDVHAPRLSCHAGRTTGRPYRSHRLTPPAMRHGHLPSA